MESWSLWENLQKSVWLQPPPRPAQRGQTSCSKSWSPFASKQIRLVTSASLGGGRGQDGWEGLCVCRLFQLLGSVSILYSLTLPNPLPTHHAHTQPHTCTYVCTYIHHTYCMYGSSLIYRTMDPNMNIISSAAVLIRTMHTSEHTHMYLYTVLPSS